MKLLLDTHTFTLFQTLLLKIIHTAFPNQGNMSDQQI